MHLTPRFCLKRHVAFSPPPPDMLPLRQSLVTASVKTATVAKPALGTIATKMSKVCATTHNVQYSPQVASNKANTTETLLLN